MISAAMCLAFAIYFEARGEPDFGQRAVAEVVLNRVYSNEFPDDICSVVKQPKQFSFLNRGTPAPDKKSKSWKLALELGTYYADLSTRNQNTNLVKGSEFYHTKSVNPWWNRKMELSAVIGQHKFWRDS